MLKQGKTRLALEFAERLRTQGWYAGSLPKGAPGVEWLAQATSPVCVVVDSAESRIGSASAMELAGPTTRSTEPVNVAPGDVRRLMQALRARADGPAVIILTARKTTGGWLEAFDNEVKHLGLAPATTPVSLPAAHPGSEALFSRAFRALAPGREPAQTPVAGPTWTTLDYVLLAWLAAHREGSLPTTKASLYAEALVHEIDYWVDVYRDLRPGITPRASAKSVRRELTCGNVGGVSACC